MHNKQIYFDQTDALQWANKLGAYYLNFGNLEDFGRYDDVLRKITPAEVKEIAQKMFSQTKGQRKFK